MDSTGYIQEYVCICEYIYTYAIATDEKGYKSEGEWGVQRRVWKEEIEPKYNLNIF